jgi:PBSX family phage terminase large subunit
MKLKPFSRKQLEVIATSNARINVLDGPVRSGKTMASIIRWIKYLQDAPPGDLLMSGKTKHTIRRNVLQDFFEIIGRNNYRFNSTDGIIECFGRRIHVVGANDERAEEKIRGMTIAGWYDDETTLKPESFFKQALARMSVEGAKAFLTTNPDSPYHWLNTDYLENEELIASGILKRFRFTFDDNLALSDEYKESLKKLYSGLWYKRMILGLWVMAEGAVYDMFSDEVHVVDQLPDRFERYFVGVDFGTSNATVFLLIGQIGNAFYVIKEYYYDSREKGRQKSTPEYSSDFKEFISGVSVSRIFIDPSAAPLIVQLRRDGIHNIRQADNDVTDGIAAVASALSTNRLFVHRSCKNTIKEFMSYVWDEKAQKRGEDKPLKQFDHAMDALRYPIFALIGRPHIGVVNKPRGW